MACSIHLCKMLQQTRQCFVSWFLDCGTWSKLLKFLSFFSSLGRSIPPKGHHPSNDTATTTPRMGIKAAEITFIKKFRFAPCFWSCARRTFMLMKCINKVPKLSDWSVAHVPELENFQTRQLQFHWVPLRESEWFKRWLKRPGLETGPRRFLQMIKRGNGGFFWKLDFMLRSGWWDGVINVLRSNAVPRLPFPSVGSFRRP